MAEIANNDLTCLKCGVNLEPAPIRFEYLGHFMDYNVPRCPRCGQWHISEELADGKIKDVEFTLEDK